MPRDLRHRFLAALLCLSAAACGSPLPTAVRVERSVYLMGTLTRFVAEAEDRESGLAQLERMVLIIEQTEAELSTWRDDSTLSEVNRQPLDAARPVPPAVCDLLDQLAAWYRATDAAFDPAIGSLIDAWGLRKAGRRPDDDTLKAAIARAGFRHVEFDREACTITRRADVTFDAGGFGKGAALQRVGRAERDQLGAWLIDFGGQVAVSGEPADGAWPIAMAHPELRDIPVVELHLTEGSLATSGGSQRDLILSDDLRIGHIIDPRTGQPVSRTASVTVWHHDALAADVLSTALYVMGPDEGLAWAEARRVAACFISADAASSDVTYRVTPAFEARFELPPG